MGIPSPHLKYWWDIVWEGARARGPHAPPRRVGPTCAALAPRPLRAKPASRSPSLQASAPALSGASFLWERGAPPQSPPPPGPGPHLPSFSMSSVQGALAGGPSSPRAAGLSPHPPHFLAFPPCSRQAPLLVSWLLAWMCVGLAVAFNLLLLLLLPMVSRGEGRLFGTKQLPRCLRSGGLSLRAAYRESTCAHLRPPAPPHPAQDLPWNCLSRPPPSAPVEFSQWGIFWRAEGRAGT